MVQKRFEATWESVRTHQVPQWYEEAGLGIFIHWGLFSVPAFAEPSAELGTIPDHEWYLRNPYAEWYYNSVNVGQGPTWEHHIKTYGPDFRYEQFADMWKAEKWDPDEWADLFARAGARYVVLVTKHHDGFCLFPSKYTDYNSVKRGPGRDIVSELAAAVRRRGMRFGTYYSALVDWTFSHEPIYNDTDLRLGNCPTYEYADYAYKQSLELIDNYHPDIFWNDIGWPYAGEHMLPRFFSYYYNHCPEGVVNDRFNGLMHDFTVREYQYGEKNPACKWEMTRGLGLSFGYNANEGPEYIMTGEQLYELYADTHAHGGNLLINVGPMADGTIPGLQAAALEYLGKRIGCQE